MTKLIEITPKLKPLWKEHCKRYGKTIKKEVRKRLGFWKYHFTDEGMLGEFIMLNTSFKDGLRTKEIK